MKVPFDTNHFLTLRSIFHNNRMYLRCEHQVRAYDNKLNQKSTIWTSLFSGGFLLSVLLWLQNQRQNQVPSVQFDGTKLLSKVIVYLNIARLPSRNLSPIYAHWIASTAMSNSKFRYRAVCHFIIFQRSLNSTHLWLIAVLKVSHISHLRIPC